MTDDLIEFIKSILLVFTTLLPIINPPGGAPIFLSYTYGSSDHERKLIAKRIAINGFFLLLGAMFVGTYVLKFFGISLAVVKVGGGLVVAAAGWRLLNAEESNHEPAGDKPTDGGLMRRAFFPLTFPFTIGPGSISVAITLGASLRSRGGIDVLNLGGGMIGIFLLCTVVFYSYRFANRLLARLGETGITVFLRLSAFILLCIGVQILWNGVAELLRSVVTGV
ncbi:MarC family protein [Chitinimonas sp. BJB300]|uniref:MarC family protein n=1 Tax=Chitinimonas sp. BJB300 TaxID=1559339 RepID=UPI000C0F5D5B|nr:MarC family protein [Chitinimonas sp. BJB300]PHV11221.1 multiple antibiotic resistance (MarC)-like protein [Chitinimonas sp. BJB300]TSJ87437.1 NAAT family transporter [Chitinimonas sp. BJB300]